MIVANCEWSQIVKFKPSISFVCILHVYIYTRPLVLEVSEDGL